MSSDDSYTVRQIQADLIRQLLSDGCPENEAMLTAAAKHPPEYENGGIEIPVFKIFRSMLLAFAEKRGLSVEALKDTAK